MMIKPDLKEVSGNIRYSLKPEYASPGIKCSLSKGNNRGKDLMNVGQVHDGQPQAARDRSWPDPSPSKGITPFSIGPEESMKAPGTYLPVAPGPRRFSAYEMCSGYRRHPQFGGHQK